ncbi:MAG: hypothetical protein EP349_03900 [Alphaproteobacteria bacterium]|nr:MAG: hypothetical protein EP349_03900 [Alphaproteobacteria bacterium]
MSQKILCMIVALVVVLSGAVSAYALSCAAAPLNEKNIASVPVIFEGAAAESRELTRREKAAFKLHNLSMKGGDTSNLRVFDFTVRKPWKGVAQGQKVAILYNTYWGDVFPPQQSFLVIGTRKLGDLFWVPLCSNTVPLEHAKSQGDIAVLEQFVGIGEHTKIPAEARLCETADDCTAIVTHCGSCDCGTPIAKAFAEEYAQKHKDFCAASRTEYEHCEMDCPQPVPVCQDNLCR